MTGVFVLDNNMKWDFEIPVSLFWSMAFSDYGLEA